MAKVYVKTYGYFAYQGRTVLNPNSVVDMDDSDAEEFILRNMGELHPGPLFLAPPPPEPPGAIERPGLSTRQARAENAVSPAQQRP